MNVEIRLITPRDSIDELTELYHRAYADHAAEGRIFYASYQTPDDTRRRIGKSECWLAIRENRIIGTVNVTAPHHFPTDYPMPTNCGAFSLLAVLPELRGTGLGHRLLMLAEDRIRARDLEHAVFDTSSLARKLIAWYEKRGYAKVGTYRWDVTNYQSVVMAKRLAATPSVS